MVMNTSYLSPNRIDGCDGGDENNLHYSLKHPQQLWWRLLGCEVSLKKIPIKSNRSELNRIIHEVWMANN